VAVWSGCMGEVKFWGVIVLVVAGSGATNGTLNGEGNLVVGYAENPSSRARTGSNDLIVGYNGGWSSYGQVVGGTNNVASGAYASAVGYANTAGGTASFAAGYANAAKGAESSVLGGEHNTASGAQASVSG